MKWKTLMSKHLFENPPWLSIREDKLQSPAGTILDSYYIFEYPDWVHTIAITDRNEFVMIKQYRHAIGRTSYELSAGICEKNESHLQSAQRELKEETGYTGGNWEHWMTNSANPGTHNNLVHCFLARGVVRTNEQDLDETEEISVHLLSADEVLDLLTKDEILQSLHASALWKFFATQDRT